MSESLTKKCKQCGLIKPITKFSKNSEQKDGIDLFCNDCRKLLAKDEEGLKTYCYESGRGWNQNLFKEGLEACEKKLKKQSKDKDIDNFDELLIQKAINYYFSKINLPQNLIGNEKDKPNKSTTKKSNNKQFNITDELLDKWGEGYKPEEYQQFEKKWNSLINNYGEKTALHTEGLKVYIRYRVKEEMATAKSDIKSAKEWGVLASKAAQDAKINVSQLSKSDISGGVDLVCQIFEAVESEIGVIPLLPRLLEQPYDDADIIIWCIINYMRRLEEKPRISYRDIWNFYDEMLEEVCKQQGLTEQQTIEFKIKRNNVFRDLEQVYIEPLYKEDGDG